MRVQTCVYNLPLNQQLPQRPHYITLQQLPVNLGNVANLVHAALPRYFKQLRSLPPPEHIDVTVPRYSQ